ncbi:uncharacterized protein LOC128984708 [Macrosteles quadrilineatus]|uniref:uncharacterized protein LOC128984708 n=1 Tax=Macrosteles quadrilineatus TaxID=74068 RepID=UPI0023E23791|nr:uncharacterized protein LOC128984708 [Macrosteles quadrilineatus]
MIKLGVILAGFVPSSETPKITLEEIREVHYKLCKAIEGINSFFGIQLICLFAYIFVLAVINPYYIVDGLIRPPSSGFDKFMIVKQISWCLFAVTLLISITWVSTYTTYHVKLALMQISNNTCEFSVLDLFKINTTNITSFAGMAVTYFIVILQFESSNKH